MKNPTRTLCSLLLVVLLFTIAAFAQSASYPMPHSSLRVYSGQPIHEVRDGLTSTIPLTFIQMYEGYTVWTARIPVTLENVCEVFFYFFNGRLHHLVLQPGEEEGMQEWYTTMQSLLPAGTDKKVDGSEDEETLTITWTAPDFRFVWEGDGNLLFEYESNTYTLEFTGFTDPAAGRYVVYLPIADATVYGGMTVEEIQDAFAPDSLSHRGQEEVGDLWETTYTMGEESDSAWYKTVLILKDGTLESVVVATYKPEYLTDWYAELKSKLPSDVTHEHFENTQGYELADMWKNSALRLFYSTKRQEDGTLYHRWLVEYIR